jgi:hypothetical protein
MDHCCSESTQPCAPYPSLQCLLDLELTSRWQRRRSVSLFAMSFSCLPASALICPCRMLPDLQSYIGKGDGGTVVMDLSLPGDTMALFRVFIRNAVSLSSVYSLLWLVRVTVPVSCHSKHTHLCMHISIQKLKMVHFLLSLCLSFSLY